MAPSSPRPTPAGTRPATAAASTPSSAVRPTAARRGTTRSRTTSATTATCGAVTRRRSSIPRWRPTVRRRGWSSTSSLRASPSTAPNGHRRWAPVSTPKGACACATPGRSSSAAITTAGTPPVQATTITSTWTPSPFTRLPTTPRSRATPWTASLTSRMPRARSRTSFAGTRRSRCSRPTTST